MPQSVVDKDAWRWRARPKESKNGKGLLSAPTQDNKAFPEIDHRLPRVRMQLLEDLMGALVQGQTYWNRGALCVRLLSEFLHLRIFSEIPRLNKLQWCFYTHSGLYQSY